MIKTLVSFLAGGGAQAIARGVATFTGDKVQREANAHDEQMALRHQAAAEWAAPERTHGWNAFVDGVNRLVRPLFTFGTIGLFVWASADPITFSATMTALALVPEPLWIILGTIVVFWFGGRALQGMRAPTVDPQRVSTVLAAAREIENFRARDSRTVYDSVPPISDAEFQREMADADKPLSLPAIVEWNRRRQQGK